MNRMGMTARRLAAGGIAMMLGLGVAGPAAADRAEAQRLFLEATIMATHARNQHDPHVRAEMLSQAEADLDEIIQAHGDSPLAARLKAGEMIGGFDPQAFRTEVAVAKAVVAKADAQAPAARNGRHREVAPAPRRDGAAEDTAEDHQSSLPVTPAAGRAGKIQGDIVAALEEWMAGEEPPPLAVAAPITASESGETVTVHFPGLRLVVEEGKVVELGDIDLEVTPQGETRYGVRLLPPAELLGLEDGVPAFRITYGADPIIGVWDEEIDGLLRLSATFRDIRLETIGEDAATLLRAASLRLDQRGDIAGGLFSGDFRLELGNLTAASGTEEDATHIRLGGLDIASHALDLDVQALRRLSMLSRLAARDEDDEDAISRGVLEILAEADWSSVGGSMVLREVDVSEAGTSLVSFREMRFGTDFDGRPHDGATIAFDIGLAELHAGNAPMVSDFPPELQPHSIALKAAIERMPLRALARSGAASFDSDDDEAAEAEMDALIEQARPVLKITSASVGGNAMMVSLSGALTSDMNAALMSSGTFTVHVTGLDKVKSALDRHSREDESLRAYVPVVVALRGLGDDGMLGGAKAKVFRIEATADGQITVNGTPWEALLPKEEEEEKPTKGKAKDKANEKAKGQ